MNQPVYVTHNDPATWTSKEDNPDRDITFTVYGQDGKIMTLITADKMEVVENTVALYRRVNGSMGRIAVISLANVAAVVREVEGE